MAEGDAEKKKLADLYFNVDTSKLNEVNTILDNIDAKVLQMNKRNLNIKFDVDTSSLNSMNTSVNKAFSNIEGDSKNTSKSIQDQVKDLSDTYSKELKNMVSENKTANSQIESGDKSVNKALQKAAINVAATKEKQLIRTTAATERENAKQLSSHKSLYDQINNYAKTFLIYEGFNALKNSASELIDEMVEVEYQMVSIDRVLNDSSLDINNYRDQLIQLAYDYGNTFENVADITLRLAQAGFDAQQSLALTEKTLLALNTAELDATQATDDMVAIMSQWGLMTGDATEVAKSYGDIIDRINKVADKFPTSSADILDALKKTSSAFNLAGASIDETIAMITTAEIASQRGGKAIGTAMSNIIQQLKDEGRLNTMEDLGIEIYTDETEEEFNSVIDIITQLSEKMQELQAAGKENSVEMQELLTVFTVFRRNIGAGLLSGVAGEESTYAQVLETSLNSVGYSLQENEKHMQTAKAAQAQFNAELLKLKTEVWDGGLEDVFRSMLELGTNLVDGIRWLIDEVGLLPSAIGAVTLAFTALNKSTQASTYIDAIPRIRQIKDLYEQTGGKIKGNAEAQKKYNDIVKGADTDFKKYVKTVGEGKVSVAGYTKNLAKATVQTVTMTAVTVALQAAISAGITAAITFLVTQIDNLINANDKYIESLQEQIDASKERETEINQEKSSLQELRNEYEELARKKDRTPEEENRIYEIQEQINQLLEDTGVQVDLITQKTNEQGEVVKQVNENYDEQLEKIEAVTYAKQKQLAEEKKSQYENEKAILESMEVDYFDDTGLFKSIEISEGLKALEEVNRAIEEGGILADVMTNNTTNLYQFMAQYLNQLPVEERVKQLRDMTQEMENMTDRTDEQNAAYLWLNSQLNALEEQYDKVEEAAEAYNDTVAELYNMSGQVSSYNTFLESIAESYKDLEGPNKLIDDIQKLNTQFENGKIEVEDYFDKLQEKINSIDFSKTGKELEAYQAIFAATTSYIAEGIESLYSGFASNEIDFTDFTEGIQEAADSTLDLYTMQNELTQNAEGQWVDANNQLNEYANTLQSAKDELQSFGELLTAIGDNYNYIAEHANEAGEAMFEQTDVGTKAYTNLANSVAENLNKMKKSNSEAYDAITAKVFEAMGTNADEVANADAYITEALNGNAQALNAALNESANQVSLSTSKVTQSMGKVLSALGTAISGFTYNIKADPYIEGNFGLKTNDKGIPTGLDLPSFGFNITGTGGESVKDLGEALNVFGQDLTSLGQDSFKYITLKSNVKPYIPTTESPTSPSDPGDSPSSSSSSDEDKEYNDKLDKYKDYIDDLEKEEQRWVNKQQELGQLSSEDMQYITQQRIKRYEKYLAQVKKMTWLNKEDRLELEKEYTQEIEDLKLDYIGYLKDALDEEIKAIEDANDKKIEAIEEEADKKIEALKKVEDENDRIRKKEEYEENRKKHLEDISYWEQRTGREAQEALKEAKENLEELDEEWEDQLEDWSIEDQIAAIEQQRDEQIAAIEEAEAAEIAALQKIYDEKVKLFSETGKIIYDNSVIQSKALYNAYKTNFVDPITSDLNKLYKQTSSSSSSSRKKEYETYKIKYGDTLSEIAAKFGTTVSKIMAANPSITNKNLIYAGNTLKIPKFHEGGIVGGTQEAFALLKPNEVVLKTEWAASLNRMMKYFDNITTGNTTSITNGPTIEVKGDLVKIDANIKNKSDVDLLTRKIEKVLTDKFNIKK